MISFNKKPAGTLKMLETSWLPLTILSLALSFQFAMAAEVESEDPELTGCTINMTYFSRMADRLPLILSFDENSEQYSYVYPDRMNTVDFRTETMITLACPGSSFLMDGVNDIQLVMCSGHNRILSEQGLRRFPYFICQHIPERSLKKNGTCLNGTDMLYQVGFRLSDEKFINLYDLCFDQNNYTPLYTKHEITPTIGQTSTADDLTEFDDDDNVLYRGLSPAHAYSVVNQLGNMMTKIHPSKLADIKFPGYLVKALLSPGPDFVYRSQRVAAHTYSNTAPQWSSINEGNWRTLENAIKSLAVSRNAVLTVYTGVDGVLSLDENPMYLTRTASGHGVMPVPSIFWKVVHDEVADEAIAFVVSNDPTVGFDDIPAKFCAPDVCDIVSWVTLDIDSREKGVITCCHIRSFNNKYNNTPEIHANNLLT